MKITPKIIEGCFERTVLSCLEPVYVGDISGDTSPIIWQRVMVGQQILCTSVLSGNISSKDYVMTKMNQIPILLTLRLGIHTLISCTNLTVKLMEQNLNTQFTKFKILKLIQ